MNKKELILARRYAQAFLNVYENQLSLDQIKQIAEFARALMNVQLQMNVLLAITANAAVKEGVFNTLIDRYQLPSFFKDLVRILGKTHRLELMPSILDQVVQRSYKRRGIMLFSVKSSHDLEPRLQGTIHQFIEREADCVSMEEHRIDKQLIAGIRIMSDTLLWEYSIDKRLKEIERLSYRGSHGN